MFSVTNKMSVNGSSRSQQNNPLDTMYGSFSSPVGRLGLCGSRSVHRLKVKILDCEIQMKNKKTSLVETAYGLTRVCCPQAATAINRHEIEHCPACRVREQSYARNALDRWADTVESQVVLCAVAVVMGQKSGPQSDVVRHSTTGRETCTSDRQGDRGNDPLV